MSPGERDLAHAPSTRIPHLLMRGLNVAISPGAYLPEDTLRKLIPFFALTALVATAACKKTGEGEYEVERPVVGTTTDTIHTPSVDVGTKVDTITTPTVGTKQTEVKVPTVEVKPPPSQE